ncbi:MAG: PAS domain-containing protein [Candidatus Brocadiae bacterium]|nr:PAS domain-containing protein [Candidatus Brocadiia bacterium]
MSRLVERGRHQDLERLAASLAPQVGSARAGFESGGGEEGARLLAGIAAASGVRVTVFDAAGKVLADSGRGAVTTPDVVAAAASGRGLARSYDVVSGQDADSASFYNREVAPFVVRVASPTSTVREAADGAMTAVLVATGFAWLSVAGIGAIVLWVLWSREAMLGLALREPKAIFPRDLSGELGFVASRLEALREERQVADRSRRAEKSEADVILSEMSDAVLSVDAQARIRLVNASAARLLGIDAAGAAGKPIGGIVRAEGIADLASRAAAGQTLSTRVETPGPPPRTLDVQARPMQDPGGAVLVLRDVTEEARFADMRRDFVAGASHELRTPLSVVKGMVETLLDGALDDRARAREFLEVIERQVKSLNNLVNDLLDLGKLESRPEFTPRVTDVPGILERVAAAWAAAAKDKEVEFRFEGDDPLPRLMADAALLERAFSNIVENALRFTPRGGTVTFRTSREGDRVRVEIRDTGPGIPETHLKRIFERFYRVDRARSREAGGTGLGLSIVKHVIGLHKGEVWAESEGGAGAVFVVRLPGFG